MRGSESESGLVFEGRNSFFQNRQVQSPIGVRQREELSVPSEIGVILISQRPVM